MQKATRHLFTAEGAKGAHCLAAPGGSKGEACRWFLVAEMVFCSVAFLKKVI
jgi:hypothetical protein